jgi:hypothetical protein
MPDHLSSSAVSTTTLDSSKSPELSPSECKNEQEINTKNILMAALLDHNYQRGSDQPAEQAPESPRKRISQNTKKMAIVREENSTNYVKSSIIQDTNQGAGKIGSPLKEPQEPVKVGLEQDSGYISPDQRSPIDYSRPVPFLAPQPPAPPISDTNNNPLPSQTTQPTLANSSDEERLRGACGNAVKKRWLRQAASENESEALSTPLKKRRMLREEQYEPTTVPALQSLAAPPPIPVYNGTVNNSMLTAVEQCIFSLEKLYDSPPERPNQSILEEFVDVACSSSLPVQETKEMGENLEEVSLAERMREKSEGKSPAKKTKGKEFFAKICVFEIFEKN